MINGLVLAGISVLVLSAANEGSFAERIEDAEQALRAETSSRSISHKELVQIRSAHRQKLRQIFDDCKNTRLATLASDDLYAVVILGERLGEAGRVAKMVRHGRVTFPSEVRYAYPEIRVALATDDFVAAEAAFSRAQRQFPAERSLIALHGAFFHRYKESGNIESAFKHFKPYIEFELELLRKNSAILPVIQSAFDSLASVKTDSNSSLARDLVFEDCRKTLLRELTVISQTSESAQRLSDREVIWANALYSALCHLHRSHESDRCAEAHASWISMLGNGTSTRYLLSQSVIASIQSAFRQIAIESCLWDNTAEIREALKDFREKVAEEKVNGNSAQQLELLQKMLAELSVLVELRTRHTSLFMTQLRGDISFQWQQIEGLGPSVKPVSEVMVFCQANSPSTMAILRRISGNIEKHPNTLFSIVFVDTRDDQTEFSESLTKALSERLSSLGFRGRIAFIVGSSPVLKEFTVAVLPQFVIADSDGKIREVIVGNDELRWKTLSDSISELETQRLRPNPATNTTRAGLGTFYEFRSYQCNYGMMSRRSRRFGGSRFFRGQPRR